MHTDEYLEIFDSTEKREMKAKDIGQVSVKVPKIVGLRASHSVGHSDASSECSASHKGPVYCVSENGQWVHLSQIQVGIESKLHRIRPIVKFDMILINSV